MKTRHIPWMIVPILLIALLVKIYQDAGQNPDALLGKAEKMNLPKVIRMQVVKGADAFNMDSPEVRILTVRFTEDESDPHFVLSEDDLDGGFTYEWQRNRYFQDGYLVLTGTKGLEFMLIPDNKEYRVVNDQQVDERLVEKIIRWYHVNPRPQYHRSVAAFDFENRTLPNFMIFFRTASGKKGFVDRFQHVPDPKTGVNALEMNITYIDQPVLYDEMLLGYNGKVASPIIMEWLFSEK